MATVLELPLDTLKDVFALIGKPACSINLNLISHFKGKGSYERDICKLGSGVIRAEDIILMYEHIDAELKNIKEWPEQADEKYGIYTYIYEGIRETDNENIPFEICWGT